jgi:hypothetical protein
VCVLAQHVGTAWVVAGVEPQDIPRDTRGGKTSTAAWVFWPTRFHASEGLRLLDAQARRAPLSCPGWSPELNRKTLGVPA